MGRSALRRASLSDLAMTASVPALDESGPGEAVRPDRSGQQAGPGRRSWWRWALLAAAASVLALLALAVVKVGSAARAGVRGQQGLTDAVALLTPRGGVSTIDGSRLEQARGRLEDAQDAFAAMHRDLDDAGPAYALAERLPFVRVQVRGVRAVNGAGEELSAAALQLTSSAELFLHPRNRGTSLTNGQALADL